MKNIKYMFFLALLICFSCNKTKEENWSKIKAMNDYVLIENFILKHPDTKNLEEAIKLILTLKKQKEDSALLMAHSAYDSCLAHIYPNYYGRNAIRIITRDTLIFFDDLAIGKRKIANYAYEFLINKNYNPLLSIGKQVVNPIDSKKMLISKGYFFIIIEDSGNIEIIRQVFKLLNTAVYKYKNYISNEYYNMNFDKLNVDSKKFIESNFYNRVQIFSMEQHQNSLVRPIL